MTLPAEAALADSYCTHCFQCCRDVRTVCSPTTCPGRVHGTCAGAGIKTVHARGTYIMDKVDLLTGYWIVNPLARLLSRVWGQAPLEKAAKVCAAPHTCMQRLAGSNYGLQQLRQGASAAAPGGCGRSGLHYLARCFCPPADAVTAPPGHPGNRLCRHLKGADHVHTCQRITALPAAALQYSPLTAGTGQPQAMQLAERQARGDARARRGSLQHANAQASLWSHLTCQEGPHGGACAWLPWIW